MSMNSQALQAMIAVTLILIGVLFSLSTIFNYVGTVEIYATIKEALNPFVALMTILTGLLLLADAKKG